MADTRKEVVFTGRVQGVGFRFTTRSLSRGFDITGCVRNLPDGSVELVAEGAAGEVEKFLDALKERMAGYIRDVREKERPPTGSYQGFEIALQ